MQEKTEELAEVSALVGLHVNKQKTKILKINISAEEDITLEEEVLEEVESFTYLGSVMDEKRGFDKDVKARINKARLSFLKLKKVWSSKIIGQRTKLHLFNSTVKAVLL